MGDEGDVGEGGRRGSGDEGDVGEDGVGRDVEVDAGGFSGEGHLGEGFMACGVGLYGSS